MTPTHTNMVRAANSASDGCSRVKNAWVGGHVTLIVFMDQTWVNYIENVINYNYKLLTQKCNWLQLQITFAQNGQLQLQIALEMWLNYISITFQLLSTTTELKNIKLWLLKAPIA